MNREEKLTQLTDLMEAFIAERETYFTEDSDNPYAQVSPDCLSELRLDKLDDNTTELLKQLRVSHANDSDFFDALLDCADQEYVNGVGSRSNEVFSVLMGETFVEWPNDIAAMIDDLSMTDDDINNLVVDFCSTGGVYLDLNYCRWSLILDADRLGAPDNATRMD